MKAKVNINCKCSTRGREGVTGAIQEKMEKWVSSSLGRVKRVKRVEGVVGVKGVEERQESEEREEALICGL